MNQIELKYFRCMLIFKELYAVLKQYITFHSRGTFSMYENERWAP